MPKAAELMEIQFSAWELDHLHRQMEDFVALLRKKGVRSWTCTVWPILTTRDHETHPDMYEWHCTMQENPGWAREERKK